MGHKVHPTGFRLGITKDWQARWYVRKGFAQTLKEDLALRGAVVKRYPGADVSRVTVDRGAGEVTVTVHTARPGIIIGRGGQRVEELRRLLEKIAGHPVRLNIQEVPQPELDATVVGQHVANQLERRINFRRAARQAVQRAIQAGAKGAKVIVSGRLAGAEIARTFTEKQGRVPLHTLRADIDYGFVEARTLMGRIGVKVWIYKGDVLPPMPEAVAPPAGATAAVVSPAPAAPPAAAGPASPPPVPAPVRVDDATTKTS
ncbi:MAG: 30S ribosomal protein S3 [Chloroflexi bacterium]|nr:30S ribosomal protein S3 [Chloroflexota bacterium]